MRIVIKVSSLGRGRAQVSTWVDGAFLAGDGLFIGPWSEASEERRRRIDKWCEVAVEVIGEPMPVMT